MPDRVIRDELMRSHRYRTLSSDTVRLLFFHLLLTVDSLGNGEATSTAVGDAMQRALDEPTAAKLLSELADAGLIRLYLVGGKPYLHIPRFRQRLRYVKGKHPRPPPEIECSEISVLCAKVRLQSDHSQTTVRLQSAEVKRSDVEVKRSEVVQKQEREAVAIAPARAPEKALVEKRRPTRLPDDWFLPDDWRDWAVRLYGMEPQRAVRISLDFRDFWHAKAGPDAVKLDWLATWRRWVRREMHDA